MDKLNESMNFGSNIRFDPLITIRRSMYRLSQTCKLKNRLLSSSYVRTNNKLGVPYW